MHLRFGLAALSNKHFDNTLFPLRTPHREYLSRYASLFGVLELSQLYHTPVPSRSIRDWVAQAPAGFTFPAKLWKETVAPEDGAWGGEQTAAARRSLDGMTPLRDAGALGPVVAQFPPAFHRDDAHHAWLADLLALRPRGEFAVELRHASWWTPETRALLEDHAAPLVWSTHDKAPAPAWITGDLGYVRFTGTAYPRRGRYVTVRDRLDAILEMRARLAAEPWDECFVIVTNPFEGNAVDSLPRIAAALGEEALAKRCTRGPGEVLFPTPVGQTAFLTSQVLERLPPRQR